MKRILYVLLAALMLSLSLPFGCMAVGDVKAYGPYTLSNKYYITGSGLRYTVTGYGADAYLKGTAAAGSYTNNTLQVAFSSDDVSISDYHFVRICYRTDSQSTVCDVSMRSSVGESWLGRMPSIVCDGEWHDLIVDVSSMTGGAGPAPAGEVSISLVLKPFNSGDVTLGSSYFFDIKYIACAKTMDEVANYQYPGEDPYDAGDFTDYRYEEASDDLVWGYIDETDEKIEEILNSPTDVEIIGTKYYVANDGSDSNDGLSPEKPWKTIAKVNNSRYKLKSGDAVLFKRGDSWRTTDSLVTTNDTTYSTYGEGAKPCIICSVDASDSGKWIYTGYENIYAFSEHLNKKRDVGTIVFDGGRAWGVQVQQKDDGATRLDNGTVFNGIERYRVTDLAFDGYQDLKENLEFYHDWGSETLYLYSANGNPGDVFSSIEIVDKGHGVTGSGDNVVIDNIEIYGTGSHGIGYLDVQNLVVQNCVFKWIGGSIQSRDKFGRDYGVRYGNAVESYGSSDGLIIRNNYASQVYDCCWTAQSSDSVTMNKVEMYGNVAEFANTGSEVWNGGGSITNMNIHDNYTRYGGYGFSHQRPNPDGNFFYGGTYALNTYENCNVCNNINYFASTNALLAILTGPDQYNFHDNIYIMESNKNLGGIAANPGNGSGLFTTTPYTEEAIKRAASTGFEKGSTFYYTDPEPLGDMYDLYNPKSGVDVFEDVGSDFWGREYIDYVSLRGYFNGITPYTFAPDGTMTRAMFVTVLYRIEGKPEATSSEFADVEKGSWYEKAVAWASANGIVNGITETEFAPNSNITREQMAAIVYRYAKLKRYDLTANESAAYTDNDKISDYAREAVNWAASKQIMLGNPDGSFAPQQNSTRVQTAAVFKRTIKNSF